MAKRANCVGILYGEYGDCTKLEVGNFLLEEPSLLQYSSGTTGEPKLIRRAWTEVDTEITAYNEALNCEVDEVPIVMAPVSHSYGLICGTLSAITRGSQPVIITNKNPKFALNIVRNTENILYMQYHLCYTLWGVFH